MVVGVSCLAPDDLVLVRVPACLAGHAEARATCRACSDAACRGGRVRKSHLHQKHHLAHGASSRRALQHAGGRW